MRTLEQFVSDLRKRGKTRKQILSVALCTRWESRREDIKKMLEEPLRGEGLAEGRRPLETCSESRESHRNGSG